MQYDVQVCAIIGVHRTIRVEATSDLDARRVAERAVAADEETHVWTLPSTGETVTVSPDFIAGVNSGMCPVEITD